MTSCRVVTMPSVTFLPRDAAERLSADFDFTVSIMPPGEYARIESPRLALSFDDTETPGNGLLMFDVAQANTLLAALDTWMTDDGTLLVHCEAGMSRSAAVAQWLADHYGYRLDLHPAGIGTTAHLNRHVYRTLSAATGKDMAAYYAGIERQDRMMGVGHDDLG